METVVYNFHDETGEYVGQLQFHAGLTLDFVVGLVRVLRSDWCSESRDFT